MAKSGLFLGPTGTGKTTAARTLNPKDTFIITLSGKELPWPGWENQYKTGKQLREAGPEARKAFGMKSNLYFAKTATDVVTFVKEKIIEDPKRTYIKNIVLDDGTMAMTRDYMKHINDTRGNGYQKWTDMAFAVWNLIEHIKEWPDDLMVFINWHTSFDSAHEQRKAMTLGKLFDDKLGGLEPYFNVVMHTFVNRNEPNPKKKFFFVTQNVGDTSAKTPIEMFGKLLIPNDYAYIRQRVFDHGAGKLEEWDEETNEAAYKLLNAAALELD